ncbi:ferritin-like domain-containing protein [Rhodobaculum claviforme]|uniref:Iminophenyl-pyruvate dimer synthase domain-containing protein n=1 Tax=Rhodobaculum claviforme TaxID=1549854 RepID=A0A934TM49_9RHOB|nr:ferritin-like domain-containing protein [Rhodobaculum claviforme]MBK5928402.1 hypothetical protein [Rhodobaculum claviforme]
MDQTTRGPAAHRPEHVSWQDHLVMLLHVGAEIEHGLMLQYLYAAYSIDVDGAPPEWRPVFRRWQDSILATAKEEMGHLVTVQNVLMLLGAPPNLRRRDFPWDVEHYPFPFRLEPLSLHSAAVYLFTEMPSDAELRAAPQAVQDPLYRWFMDTGRGRMDALIAPRARPGMPLHRVEELYATIIELIGDRTRIPDSALREDSYRAQARWDDWGRRQRPPPRTLTPSGSLRGEGADAAALQNTNVLVAPVATRREAVDALRALSEQGEGPHRGGDTPQEPSHFDRFLEIFHGLETLPAGICPTLPVTPDPTTRSDGLDAATGQWGPAAGYIAHPRTRQWATLANLRYRMLLSFLAHALRAAPAEQRGEANLRGSLVHRTFGEMYAIKALSARLMRLPLRPGADTRAGPPFEVPYDVTLPPGERDTWRRHLDLVRGSIALCDGLLQDAPDDETAQLRALRALDDSTQDWLVRLLDGLGREGGAAT